MDLQLVSGATSNDGDDAGDGGRADGPESDRLTEAEGLVRRTRQRLEEIADRLAELRRDLGRPPAEGERDENTSVNRTSAGGQGEYSPPGQEPEGRSS